MSRRNRRKVYRTYHSHGGPVLVTTFERFFLQIPVRQLPRHTESLSFMRKGYLESPEFYKVDTSLTSDASFKEQVLTGLTTADIKSGSHMVEEVGLKRLYEMGSNTYIVHVGTRTWLVADPEDFQIATNVEGCALICIRPERNYVVRVSK